MSKHWIVSIVIAIGLIGFGIGVPSPQIVVYNGALSTYVQGNPTIGYFGRCNDNTDSSSCTDYTQDIYHCSQGDNPRSIGFPYYGTTNNLVDQNMCKRAVAAQAFGILAILFSFLATFSAVCRNRAHKHAGSTTALLAAIFGIIALSVWFSGTWQWLQIISFGNYDNASEAVNGSFFKLGYSAGFQIVGVIFSFFGSLLAAVYTKKSRGIPLLG